MLPFYKIPHKGSYLARRRTEAASEPVRLGLLRLRRPERRHGSDMLCHVLLLAGLPSSLTIKSCVNLKERCISVAVAVRASLRRGEA